MSDDARSLDEIMESGPITMLVTADQKARPMTVLDQDGSRLSFLTDRTTEWMEDMTENEQVAVVISDPGDSIFVSLTGTARVSEDPETLDELWSPALQAWFDGRDDPNLVAVLLAEERHRTPRDRILVIHAHGADLRIRPDRFVDQVLDLCDLVRGQRAGVREVEAQPLGGDE